MSNRIKVGLTTFNQASKKVCVFLILRDHKRIINSPRNFELIDRFDQDLSIHVITLCLLFQDNVLNLNSFEASLNQLIHK